MNNDTLIKTFPRNELIFMALGGCEQFGMNLNVYGYNNKWLVVDCGIGFADERYPGVDILLPDPEFLEQRAKDLLGIFVTHAHEDHIGAIPYVWSRLKCPIYCTPFVASFLRRKCSEFGDVRGMVINEIMPDELIVLGDFRIGVIGVTHSTPSTISLTIDTPAGLVVHGNEWNLDPTPTVGTPTNREAFKIAGRKGVLAYIGDSTNAPYAGESVGEAVVQKGLENTFEACNGRIIVTIFASNVGRMISVMRAAHATGRHVCVAGRSLYTYSAIAAEHNMLRGMPPFLDAHEALTMPPSRIVYLVTGSQGEARAAMARIARGDFRDIKCGTGDTVIFSSRAIPGNEREINRVKGDILASGATVIDTDCTSEIIHATGHPYRDEIAQMLDWVRPKIVVPIHGERLHLEAQAEIARGKQVPHVIVPENGTVIALRESGPAILGMVRTDILAVEPSRVISSTHTAITERRNLQTTGALHVTGVMDHVGNLLSPFRITGIGLFDNEDPEDAEILTAIQDEMADTMAEVMGRGMATDTLYVTEELRIAARRVVNATLGFKPKTTVHVIKVG